MHIFLVVYVVFKNVYSDFWEKNPKKRIFIPLILKKGIFKRSPINTDPIKLKATY
jgi:hypothetical protein